MLVQAGTLTTCYCTATPLHTPANPLCRPSTRCSTLGLLASFLAYLTLHPAAHTPSRCARIMVTGAHPVLVPAGALHSTAWTNQLHAAMTIVSPSHHAGDCISSTAGWRARRGMRAAQL
jgi:hypothetical protein